METEILNLRIGGELSKSGKYKLGSNKHEDNFSHYLNIVLDEEDVVLLDDEEVLEGIDSAKIRGELSKSGVLGSTSTHYLNSEIMTSNSQSSFKWDLCQKTYKNSCDKCEVMVSYTRSLNMEGLFVPLHKWKQEENLQSSVVLNVK